MDLSRTVVVAHACTPSPRNQIMRTTNWGWLYATCRSYRALSDRGGIANSCLAGAEVRLATCACKSEIIFC